MRNVAQWTMYLGMTIAVLGGAQWPRPAWTLVAAGLAVIAVGIVIKRRAGAPSLDEEHGSGDVGNKPARTGTLTEAIAQFATETMALAGEAESLDLEAIKKRCEELIWIGPERVAQSQEAIAAKIGFSRYAEVMAPLATAERWLFRAWSAAADGHRPEVIASIVAAGDFAHEAEALGRAHLSGFTQTATTG